MRKQARPTGEEFIACSTIGYLLLTHKGEESKEAQASSQM